MHIKSIMSSLLCIASSICADNASPLLEIKPSYFFFADTVMRDVYHKGGFEIQASGSYPIWNFLEAYAGVGYMQARGKSLCADQKTFINQVLVDVGLKPVVTLHEKVDYYFGFGPRYFHVHQHNDSCYVNENIYRNGIGFFTNTGFNFVVTKHAFIGIFGEYSYQKASFCSSKTNVYGQKRQVGGFAFGGSLGYKF